MVFGSSTMNIGKVYCVNVYCIKILKYSYDLYIILLANHKKLFFHALQKCYLRCWQMPELATNLRTSPYMYNILSNMMIHLYVSSRITPSKKLYCVVQLVIHHVSIIFHSSRICLILRNSL